jgi:hypothetical protein
MIILLCLPNWFWSNEVASCTVQQQLRSHYMKPYKFFNSDIIFLQFVSPGKWVSVRLWSVGQWDWRVPILLVIWLLFNFLLPYFTRARALLWTQPHRRTLTFTLFILRGVIWETQHIFSRIWKELRGPGSSVGTVTDYGLDDPGIESRWGRDFPNLSRPALGPIQPPLQWVPGLSRG